MTQQYIRALSLVVGSNSQAFDLSQLHVRFQVKNANVQTLKTAEIQVFNMKDDLAKLIQNEFTRVELSAGYAGNLGLIFQGEITMVRRGKENATDTFIEIQAQDGDKAFNWATSSWPLAKGYLPDDLYKRCLQDLAPYGISAGYKPEFTKNASVDSITVHSQTRDVLRNLADGQKCSWGIEDSKLLFTPLKGYIPGTVPSLNSASGLIGTPQQTLGGLVVRCLLNPAIRAGGQINVDNQSIATLNLTSKYQKADIVPSIDNDGAYKAFQVIHTGDSRGNAWYTECVCAAIDGTAPLTSNFTEAVPENG